MRGIGGLVLLGGLILVGCDGAPPAPPGGGVDRPAATGPAATGPAPQTLDEFRRENLRLERELARARLQAAGLERENAELRQKLDDLLRGRPDLAQVERLTRQVSALTDQIRALQAAQAALQEHRPPPEGGNVAAAALRLKIEALEQENRRLEGRLGQLDEVLQGYVKAGIPPEIVLHSGAAVPETPIRAEVLAVRAEVQTVMLSAGSADGVKDGYTFTVWRGDRFVARVQVQKLFSEMCSARILELAPEMELRVGDVARTRF